MDFHEPNPNLYLDKKGLSFFTLGILNIALDFAILNGCVLLFQPATFISFLLISLFSCSCGMISSYAILRQRFSRTGQILFFLFALVSILINTSVFTFGEKYLVEILHIQSFWAINLAKTAGILTGTVLGLLCYFFVVFKFSSILKFKESFDFQKSFTSPTPFWKQACILAGGAALVRGAFLLLTTSIYGDAIHYSSIASDLAIGNFDHIDRFWVSLFCYWEALFYLIGFPQLPATILSTFIPGILLLFPVCWIARMLYGSSVAWLAGLFCIFHPRLVSYSTNGYAEMFYLLMITTGIGCITYLIQHKASRIAALGWGVSFAAYVTVREEGILLFLLTLSLPFWISFNQQAIKMVSIALFGFLLTTASYIEICELTIHNPGLFEKIWNVHKQYTEQLDFEQSVKEIYNENHTTQTAQSFSLSKTVVNLMYRFPRSVGYTVQRLPGVLTSPIVIFALLLPLFATRQNKKKGEAAPLIMMLLFPLIFYLFIQVDIRYLISILIPIHIFGAAGLYAFYHYLSTILNGKSARLIFRCLVGFILITEICVCIWLGFYIDKQDRIQKKLAAWIDQHTGSDELVTGDGYGYITATGFLSHRPTIARIWADDPQKVVAFMKKNHSHWLILYQPFLDKGNPEFLPVLDNGIPGTKKMYEIKDENGKRYQIYYLE